MNKEKADGIVSLTKDEWLQRGKERFGKDYKEWKFKCPSCGNIQSIHDFEDASIENPEQKVFFSCIGRWNGHDNDMLSGKSPCNYTLGGLFKLHHVEVINEEGYITSVFEFAESEVK